MKIFKRRGIRFTYAKGAIYCLEPVFLDIETSNNHAEDISELRCWITSIQVYFNGKYYLFRYPEELVEFYKSLYKRLDLYPTRKFRKKLITYIHNASYDLSYLIPYINMLPDYDYTNQGIIEGPNKILTYVRGSLEFKCSYRLSGMSLEKWSKEMNIEHKKQVGLYDYESIIYPDTELSDKEQKYDEYDVLAMSECMDKQLSYHRDSLVSVPLTSTGYVRRDLRASCKKDKYYRQNYFWDTRLNADLYSYCLKSYAGGMTHNNRFYRDTVVRGCIGHRDFKSHYPTQMTCYDFPLGTPQLIYKNDMGYYMTIGEILSWSPQFSSMSVIRMYEAELRDNKISMPFMQFSKCYEASFSNRILDNGRILYAKGEWIMFLDNLTLETLSEQYEIEYEVLEVYRMLNKPLPDCIISVIDKYFKGKSDKKNEVHELTTLYGKLDNRTIEAEFDLMQQKKFLNAIYGCTATNPLRDSYEITDKFEFRMTETHSNMDEIQAGLDKYYKGAKNFLPYQIGVWVTARARYELYQYIKAIGYDNCLYCDTDSIFYIKNDTTEAAIEALNAEKRKTAHYVTLNNSKIEYYDEFTSETDCIAFKGLHSKCYGVVTNKGLELTIAGVPARTLIDVKDDGTLVYYSREEELSQNESDPIKALDKLTDGVEFKINSGVSAVYIGANGFETQRVPEILNIDGHEVHTAGGCVIRKLDSKRVRGCNDQPIISDNVQYNFDISCMQ